MGIDEVQVREERPGILRAQRQLDRTRPGLHRVLLEAAVRNYILQLRGIDSTAEFISRQKRALGSEH